MGGGADFGDIGGLHNLVTVAQKAAPEFETADHVLSKHVHDLTADAWIGKSAQAFSAAWGKDSEGARAVSSALGHVGGTVSKLAHSLGEAKKLYDSAEASAKEQGVPLLQPGEQTVLPGDKMAKAQHVSQQANAAIKAAQAARTEAMAELEPLVAALNPSAAKTGPAMNSAQAAELEKMGMGDYVKLSAAASDLYAAPAVAVMIKDGRLNTAEQAYVAAKNAFSEAGGKGAPRSEYQLLKQAKKDTLKKLKMARGEATEAEALASKVRGSRAAATDLEGLFGKFGKDISKLKILKGAPLIDVAATGFSVYDDVENRHWSVPHAVVADGAATAAGVGATAAVIAAAPEAAPAVLVAGAGVVVGYEGTEAVNALTHDAHWGDNIHKYGVVDGVGHSFADAGKAFAHNNVETFDKVKNTVGDASKSVWHGITSVF